MTEAFSGAGWEVTPQDQAPLYYVGMTGDTGSINAQSPFNRMGQHLGFNDKGNPLRRYLGKHQLEPEACGFRLVALGPVESEAVERAEHDKRRDVVAAMEKALAGGMRDAGYRVMNEVASRKTLDAARFSDVLLAFAEKFPALSRAAR